MDYNTGLNDEKAKRKYKMRRDQGRLANNPLENMAVTASNPPSDTSRKNLFKKRMKFRSDQRSAWIQKEREKLIYQISILPLHDLLLTNLVDLPIVHSLF